MLLTDHGASHRDAIAPFVLSRPQWLVAPDGEVPTPPGRWHERPLLFFTGHVPKLYINPTRYLIWRQVRVRLRVRVRVRARARARARAS